MTFPKERSSKNLSKMFPDAILAKSNRTDNHRDVNQEPQQQNDVAGEGQRRPVQPVLGLWNVAAIVVVSLCTVQTVQALTCFETVDGKATIAQDDSWTYCALVPVTTHGNEMINGSQFGLGPENDLLTAYNTAFGISVNEYRILTVCVYERYDFSRFMKIRPVTPMVEFAFRCVCNYDLCNSETTFSAYLSNIKTESFAKR